MVRPIMKDMIFLAQKSEDAARADITTAFDLMDTLRAHSDECVGMAANMIGVRKRIIVFNAGDMDMIMINPVITKKSDPYETEEGCLSLSGTRKTTRYEKIEVSYLDMSFAKKKGSFSGWTAQIIQHEIDHCNGIII